MVRNYATLIRLATDPFVCIQQAGKLPARRDTPDERLQPEGLFSGMVRTQ